MPAPAVEAAFRCRPRRAAKLVAQLVIAGQPGDAGGQRLTVAWRVRQRVGVACEDLPGAAGIAGNHRSTACHRFGDHQSKWLGGRAGVHHDVEGADRFVRCFDEAGKADAAVEPDRVGVCTQFLDAVLAAGRVIQGAADDVGADRRRLARRATASRKVVCPFHRPNVPTSPTRTVPAGAGGSPASRSRSRRTPDGLNRCRSTALCTATTGTSGRSEACTSAATLAELATTASQCRTLHRRNRAVAGLVPT